MLCLILPAYIMHMTYLEPSQEPFLLWLLVAYFIYVEFYFNAYDVFQRSQISIHSNSTGARPL